MITNTTREILYNFVKDNIFRFRINIFNVDIKIKKYFKTNPVKIKEFIMDAFNHGYLITYDNKLEEKDISEELENDLKLLCINVDKIFADDIFNDFEENDNLKEYYNRAKFSINDSLNKGLFLSHLSSSGNKDASKKLTVEIKKIYNCINRTLINNNSTIRDVELQLFYDSYRIILNILESIPTEYGYGKEYFVFKNYCLLAKKMGSSLFKDISRNDDCPCGSSKKYKKCCLI